NPSGCTRGCSGRGRYGYSAKLSVRLPTQNNQLVITGCEAKLLVRKFRIIERAAPAPTNCATLKPTCKWQNIPNHVRVRWVRIDINEKGVRPIIWSVDKSTNSIVSGI